jgi:tetratricopeptide (TPR) repeat protein
MRFPRGLIISLFLLIFLVSACSNFDIEKLNNKANALMNSGDTDGAIARLESINDLNPNYPQTHYNLGIAYHKKKNFDKAITSLNEAIRLKKDFADAYYTIGVVYEEIALTIVEEKKNPDAKDILTILDYFKKAQGAYAQYLDLAINPTDSESVNAKIETLSNDIKKYDAIMDKKHNSYY